MFTWMSCFLQLSRMFYTENQRKVFFEIVDGLYEKYCIQYVREMVPSDRLPRIEALIEKGANVDEWWDEECFSGIDKDSFLKGKVYKAMYDDVVENGAYWEEVCEHAPMEKPEDWYANSFVKALLHEFINDDEDPYKLVDHFSDREIACLSYTICSILTIFIKESLDVSDEDADYMLSVLYCGEFAQNDWLNKVYGENVKEIRSKVTKKFLYAFLDREYSQKAGSQMFYEYLDDEILEPVFVTIYDHRFEILGAARKYLADYGDNRWTQKEMDDFCQYIIKSVPMRF